jgi:hypothetical protein
MSAVSADETNELCELNFDLCRVTGYAKTNEQAAIFPAFIKHFGGNLNG